MIASKNVVHVNAIHTLQQFKSFGFTTLGGFVGVVQSLDKQFFNYKKVNDLVGFWFKDAADEDLNNRLLNVLEKLKNE